MLNDSWVAAAFSYHRNQQWRERFGSFATMASETAAIRTVIEGSETVVNTNDIALQQLMNRTSEDQLHYSYGLSPTTGLKHAEAVKIVQAKHPDHLSGFNKKIAEMKTHTPILFYRMIYHDLPPGTEGVEPLQDYLLLRQRYLDAVWRR